MMDLDTFAGIVDAEASVLDFQGKLGVAQCIIDNRYNANAFARPVKDPSKEAFEVANLSINAGARRFTNTKILQFRSFKRYGINEEPNFEKIYSETTKMPPDLLYLGKDGTGNFGHFYFGRYTKLKPFKMLLIAGHGRNQNGSWDPGAIGCGYQEADMTRQLVKLIKRAADLNNLPCDVAEDKNYFSYFKSGGSYDFTPYKYVLEIHFNASATKKETPDGEMKGSMFFIDETETGHSVEDKILQGLYSIGSKQAWDGATITQKNYPTGLLVQKKVRDQGVSHGVLETCFITDADDMEWYKKKKELIATKIVEGIIEGFGLNKTSNPYAYVGKGIGSATAQTTMNVRDGYTMDADVVGIVLINQDVEVLEVLQNGWLKIVWPGSPVGYGYTSNVNGKFYKLNF